MQSPVPCLPLLRIILFPRCFPDIFFQSLDQLGPVFRGHVIVHFSNRFCQLGKSIDLLLGQFDDLKRRLVLEHGIELFLVDSLAI